MIPRSYGGNSWFAKFHPRAVPALAASLPTIVRALARRKVTVRGVLRPHKLAKRDLRAVRTIYRQLEIRPQRRELNLYTTGHDPPDGIGKTTTER